MSIIVEQTLPYSTKELKLEDPTRWSRLFPLLRPSIKAIETENGHTVVVDTALSKTKDTLITAVGSVGNFSSKILSESHLAAFTTEQNGKSISAGEIRKVLKENGFPVQNGVVVVRSSSSQNLEASVGIVELSVVGELRLDHVLSLLSATKPEIK
jgi:dihydroxyacetone kinase